MRSRQHGFTLIEIMVVVAIIGVLAAIAIPMFMGHMKRAKTSEANLQLNMLAKSGRIAYQVAAKFPQGTAGVQPGADGTACSQPGRRFDATNAWASDPVWLELDFHIDEPALFSYHYESTTPASAVATAVGDLDCDKTLVTYRLEFSAPDGMPAAVLTEPSQNAD